MDIAVVAACLLPILFLMAFVGGSGKKYLIYLLWGFLSSVPLLFFPEELFTKTYLTINISPILEEFLKALPIIIPALIGIKNKDEDLLVCAMAAGIGFSIVENLRFVMFGALPFDTGSLFVANLSLVADPSSPQIMSVLAWSFSSTLMHGCTTAIIGYGIVLIRNFDRHALPTLIFGFYTIAVTIHALYNLLILKYGEMGLIIDFIFPVFLFFVLHACYHVDIPVFFKKEAGE
jgi:RsiW-degrading membrane proteinase PrsW (M82 family)